MKGKNTAAGSEFSTFSGYFCVMETIVHAQTLTQLAKSVFLAMGCPPHQAQLAADVLVSADLRGIDSHGLARYRNVRVEPTEEAKAAVYAAYDQYEFTPFESQGSGEAVPLDEFEVN